MTFTRMVPEQWRVNPKAPCKKREKKLQIGKSGEGSEDKRVERCVVGGQTDRWTDGRVGGQRNRGGMGRQMDRKEMVGRKLAGG